MGELLNCCSCLWAMHSRNAHSTQYSNTTAVCITWVATFTHVCDQANNKSQKARPVYKANGKRNEFPKQDCAQALQEAWMRQHGGV